MAVLSGPAAITEDSRRWMEETADAFQELAALLDPRTPDARARLRAARIGHRRPAVNGLERVFERCLAYDTLVQRIKHAAVDGLSRLDVNRLLEAFVLIRNGATSIQALDVALSGLGNDRPGLSGERLAEAVRARIDLRYAHRLTIRVFAKEFSASEATVRRVFRQRFGSTIRDYVTSMRAIKGLELIEHGLKVEAAALEVGYRSKKNFYNAVRKLTGGTPSAAKSCLADAPKRTRSAR